MTVIGNMCLLIGTQSQLLNWLIVSNTAKSQLHKVAGKYAVSIYAESPSDHASISFSPKVERMHLAGSPTVHSCTT